MFKYAVYCGELGVEESPDVCLLVNYSLGSELSMTMTF